jgi:Family of unknown function (DUF6152)
MNIKVMGRIAVVGLLAGLSAPALAHHSVAMFNLDKQITVKGSVIEFQWTNPHSWLRVGAVGPDGKTVQWAFEAQGPSTLLRKGIKVKTFAPGDKVTVLANPMKDGRPGGLLISATSADGHVYTFK